MSSLFGKLKSGADKAAFEADRMVRLNQAQSALKAIQRELEAEVVALGHQALDLYDTRSLTQPELLERMPQIESVRQRIATQEAEVERVRQEKPPEAGAPQDKPAPVTPTPRAPAPPAAAAPLTPTPPPYGCPNCGTALKPGVRFCPECGFRVADS